MKATGLEKKYTGKSSSSQTSKIVAKRSKENLNYWIIRALSWTAQFGGPSGPECV